MSTFYDIHATDFSNSRISIWPLVKQFLNTFPSNSRVLDIGCGNGKNMLYRSDIDIYGIEQSDALCKICIDRGLDVIQSTAMALPFKDNIFDGIIMIAVIHHIQPENHYKVLEEIRRVLKPNGKCLITNWAVEQPDNARRQFTKGLNIVEWKGKETDPLTYWVMDREIAEEFIQNLPNDIKCVNFEWNKGNWYFTLERVVP